MHFFEETYFDILVNLTKSQLTIPIKKSYGSRTMCVPN